MSIVEEYMFFFVQIKLTTDHTKTIFLCVPLLIYPCFNYIVNIVALCRAFLLLVKTNTERNNFHKKVGLSELKFFDEAHDVI